MDLTIPAGSLMEAVLDGQRVEASLSDPTTLKQAVEELVEATARQGGVPVLAVGQAAAMIVGAAAVSSHTGVRQAALPVVGGQDYKVLVVQAVAVGEGVLQRAVQEARRDGADWVGAWVWRADQRFDSTRADADEVQVGQRTR